MSKKALFCANIDLHLKGFHTPYMELLIRNGWSVYAASSRTMSQPLLGVTQIDLPVSRNPFSLENADAVKMLADLLSEEKFDLLQCATPTGAAVARLAARRAGVKGCYIMYNALGFHFFKGGPKRSWAMYYPIEKFLARKTDMIVTLNQEDYELARDRLHVAEVHKLNGVGFETDRFTPVSRERALELRKERGIPPDREVMLYTAEINANKNHVMAVRALKRLADVRPKLHFYLLGREEAPEPLNALVSELGLNGRVHKMGYVSDPNEWMRLADVVVSASKREGLGQNVPESMACGKIVVATRIRGHMDAIEHGVSGYLVELGDDESFARYIEKALESPSDMPERAVQRARLFSNEYVYPAYSNLYRIATNMDLY